MTFRVADKHKIDCAPCYGQGCSYCGNRGWHESEAGTLDREDAEDRYADEMRERRALGED